MKIKIDRLNHSSFLIKTSDKNIFIDPYQIDSKEKADLILITHPHFDHFSSSDIKKIAKDDTVLVSPDFHMHQKLKDMSITIKPWETLSLEDIKITGVPSYNKQKHYHPKANGWLGFVIESNGKKAYHAGDTDLIDEMKEIGCVDYALLPVSGNYTMNPIEAAKAAKMLNAKTAIPMHYSDNIGKEKDALDFKKLCPCKVELM